MRPRLVIAGVSVLVVSAALGGCGGKSSTAPGNSLTSDPAQVASVLAAAASLVDDDLAEDPSRVGATALEPAGSTSIEAAIRPHSWWQHITQETRTWSFAWSDTDSTSRPRTCVATLKKQMTGTLVIIPASATDSTAGDSSHVITKPIDKTLIRRVMLQRIALGNGREWKVVQVSGAFVETPSATTHLVSLRFQTTSGVDTTITDPLQWFSLRHILKFGASDTVTVTATTTRLDDPVFIHRWDWRHRLHNNLDHTYSYTWVTSAWPGWRHLGIQAMTRGSIYDDTLPFDMQAWHLPFRVQGGQADVDYYP